MLKYISHLELCIRLLQKKLLWSNDTNCNREPFMRDMDHKSLSKMLFYYAFIIILSLNSLKEILSERNLITLQTNLDRNVNVLENTALYVYYEAL